MSLTQAIPILEVRGVYKSYLGGLQANLDLSLSVSRGETRALIGPNGAGKTTLINQITGHLRPDRGEIRLKGHRINGVPPHTVARMGVGRTFQKNNLMEAFTVFENARLALQSRLLGERSLWRFWRPAETLHEVNAAVPDLLARVGLEERAGDPVHTLSHGEKRQLELALALAGNPELLLLDEPMAGMSVEETRRITALLKDLKRHHAIVLVEHDMDTVFTLADTVSVLVYGTVLATGSGQDIRENPEVQEAYLGTE